MCKTIKQTVKVNLQITVKGRLTVCNLSDVSSWRTSQYNVSWLNWLDGAQFSVPVTRNDFDDWSYTEVTVTSWLKTLLLILMDISGSGFPPIERQVHVFDVPAVTVVGPVRVGLLGLAEKKH